jgi:hypothetical protein
LSAITGTSSACQGLSSILVNPGSGTWSSSDASIATVGSASALVTGVSAGTAIITFVTYITGCSTTKTYTVYPYSSVISGASSVCATTPITLTNTISGGLWTSSNPTIARIGSVNGIVTGVGNGTTNITYTNAFGCRASRSISSSTGCKTSGGSADENILTETISEFRLIPNPNKGAFIIKGMFATEKDVEATIEVVDMLGQIVYKAKTMAINGNLNEQIQLNSNLANGMYLLNLRSDSETKVFHFVLER